jgi:hypothetical protein
METQAMGDTGTEDNDVEAHDAAAPRSTAAVAGLENDTEKEIGTAAAGYAAAAAARTAAPAAAAARTAAPAAAAASISGTAVCQMAIGKLEI